MSATLSRPSRLFLYIAGISTIILMFRFWKVNAPPTMTSTPEGQAIAQGIGLKILPLGDSITEGHSSSDRNGYRLMLHNSLMESGSTVNMVGTLTSGENYMDNHHEGYGGASISGVLERVLASGALRQHPNVILLQAGTNDLKEVNPPVPEPFDDAPHRISVLIDAILCESPEAVLLVAKLPAQPLAQDRVDSFNAALEGIATEKNVQGLKIKTVDQSKISGLELADELHPNDVGYKTMAQNWYEGLRGVPQHWFANPRDAAQGLQKTCGHEDSYWANEIKPHAQ